VSKSKMFSSKKSEKSLFSLFNLVILFVCLFLVSRSAKCEDETTTITTDIATFETTTLFSFIEEDRGIKSGKSFEKLSTKVAFDIVFKKYYS
jgi:hypothetical protein